MELNIKEPKDMQERTDCAKSAYEKISNNWQEIEN